jgi:signal peptidase I
VSTPVSPAAAESLRSAQDATVEDQSVANSALELPAAPELTAATHEAVFVQRNAVPYAHPVRRVVLPHLLDTVRSFISVIVIALFVLTFIVQPFRIPSESMERTLLVGDFLLVNKMAEGHTSRLWGWVLPYRNVHRGDIVVFHFPAKPSEYLVKRVVGIPGDHIRLINGVVYLNGKAQQEPYAIYRGSYPDSFRDQFPNGPYTDPGVDPRWWIEVRHNLEHGEIVVPPGHYFVLGDNRNNSRDSRYWGFVPGDNIVGQPFVIYFSVRGISPLDPTPLPGDRIAHDNSLLSALVDFARWDRMFQIVR